MKLTDKRCRNCHQHLLMHQKFCHACGQKTDTHRINMHFLAHEIQHGVFHIDGGILYTLKELFTRPGHTLREYLEGKRRQHFPPLLFVIIMGSLCAFVQYFTKKETPAEDHTIINSKISDTSIVRYVDFKGLINYFHSVYDWLAGHFAFTVLLVLPIAALGFFLGFRKYKLNYPEWFVLMLFLAGQSLAVYVFFIIINSYFGDHSGWFYLISWGLVTFSLVQFFNERGKYYVMMRTAWAVLLTYIFSFIYLVIAVTVIALIGILLYGYDSIYPLIMQKI